MSSLSNGQTTEPEEGQTAQAVVPSPAQPQQQLGHLARAFLLACAATAISVYLILNQWTGAGVVLVVAWAAVGWAYLLVRLIQLQAAQQSKQS